MPIKQEGRLEAVCEHQHKVCNEEGAESGTGILEVRRIRE
jgi:hypothetical protein